MHKGKDIGGEGEVSALNIHAHLEGMYACT